jgi:hypothetical protein
VQSFDSSICPVWALRDYAAIRPPNFGPFFCHFDQSPLTQLQFNVVLQKVLAFLGLERARIKGHSFRIGVASSAFHMGVAKEAFLSYIRPLPVCRLANIFGMQFR